MSSQASNKTGFCWSINVLGNHLCVLKESWNRSRNFSRRIRQAELAKLRVIGYCMQTMLHNSQCTGHLLGEMFCRFVDIIVVMSQWHATQHLHIMINSSPNTHWSLLTFPFMICEGRTTTIYMYNAQISAVEDFSQHQGEALYQLDLGNPALKEETCRSLRILCWQLVSN